MTSAVRDLVVRFRGDTSDVEDSASGLAKTLGVAGVAAGGAFALAAVGAMNVEAANDKLAAQLGASGQYAKDLGKVAGDLYSNAYGESLEQVNEAIRGVIQSGLVMEDASNAQLQSVTAKVLDLSTAFDQDLGGATEAVGQLMKTGLAPNAEAALDVVTRGFQEGADRSGDFLDTLTEYSVQFQKFGLDAGTATGILVQGMDAGARNSDLVADAIKEFSIRAVDGSKLTADGFTAIGLSAGDMATQIGKGGPESAAALDTVLDRLRAMPDPVARSQAAVALFGTQAEDLGDALFALDPSEAVNGLGNVAGAAERMGDTLNDNATANLTAFKRQAEAAFVDILGGKVLPVVNEVSGVLATYFGPTLKLLGDILGGVVRFVDEFKFELGVLLAVLTVSAIALNTQAIAVGAYLVVMKVVTVATRAWAVVQGVLNAVMAANPVTLVILAVVALAAAVVIAYRRSETFRDIVQGTWEAIQTAALYAWENILKPVFEALVVAYQSVADVALWLWNSIIQPAWAGISAAIEVAQVAIGIYIDAVKLYFTVMADVVMWLWNTIITPAWNGISFAIEVAKDAIGLWIDAIKLYFDGLMIAAQFLWDGLVVIWDGIKFVIDVARAAIGLYIDGIKLYFDGMMIAAQFLWDGLVVIWDGIKFVIGIAKDAIGLYIDGIKLYFTTMGDTIMAVWNFVISPAFESLKTGVGLVGTAFSDIVGGIETVWNRMTGIMAKPINFFINTIWNDGVVKAWDKILGWIPGMPGLGKLDPVPEGFATGGKVPGSGNRDTVPALLTPGEFVVRKPVAEGALRFLTALNQGQAEAWQAAGGWNARGPARFAAGGLVAADNFARAQVGKPYVWGAVGPGSYDCSGLWSAIVNVALGMAAHARRFATASFGGGGAGGLVPGRGALTVGVQPGHMAGTLAGTAFEATPPRVRGPGARGATAFPRQFFLPQIGGAFVEGGGGGGFFDVFGKILDLLNPVKALIDPGIDKLLPGVGPYKDLAKRLPHMVVDGAINFAKDKAQDILGIVGDVAGAIGGFVGGDASVRHQVNMVSRNFGMGVGGWGVGGQWAALDRLIQKESSWNPNAQNPRSTAYGLYQFLDCVPLDTEILTRDGWKRYSEVSVGDETLGYNPETGRNEWTEILDVVVKSPQRVVHIGSDRWSARVTPGHRWWTNRRAAVRVDEDFDTCPECGVTGTKRGPFKNPKSLRVHRAKTHGVPTREPLGYQSAPVGGFCRTDQLTAAHDLVLAAPADTGGALPISDDEAKILGWIAGDGHIHGDLDGTLSVSIYQSKPNRIAELRQLLADVPHSEYSRQRQSHHLLSHSFYLHAAYARELLKRSGWLHGAETFVLACSPSQRDAWLSGMIAAEGSYADGAGQAMRIPQNDGPVAEAIVLAVYLSGWRPSRRRNRPGFSQTTLSRPGQHAGMLQQVGETTEAVWCVRTKLGTWTMRQGEQISLTGNSTWATVGGRKTSDPGQQALYGNRYIQQRYGDPVGALAFHNRNNWYENGGWVGGKGPKLIVAHGGEYVLTADEAAAVSTGNPAGGTVINIDSIMLPQGATVDQLARTVTRHVRVERLRAK